MNINLHVFRSVFGKALLASAALGGFLLFAGASGAKATNGWDDCNRRVTYTQYRYNLAAERYGPYSSAARHWAHERHEAYIKCERLRRDRDWDRR